MKIKIINSMISFLLLSQIILLSISANATMLMEVDFPSEVVEGENFEVLVTSGGEPVYQAEVTVEWQDIKGFRSKYYTNKQGIVNLTAPSVDHNTRYYIKVDYEGSGMISYIMVLDHETPRLVINVQSSVNERDNFEVMVTSNGEPVDQVHITVDWDYWLYFTDSYGITTIEAPSVSSDTVYSIYASKSGYIFDEVEITVLNYFPQLIIDAPNEVEEGQYFNISITADDNPVQYVNVLFNDQYFYTDTDGIVSTIAPSVDSNKNILIRAFRSDYLEDTDWIMVTDSEEVQYELSIDAPLSVFENKTFIVTVYNGTLEVENAVVRFAENDYVTDITGCVIITSPLIEEDTKYNITASKVGYLPAFKEITIKNSENYQDEPNLIIYGRITNNSNMSIDGAIVSIYSIDDASITISQFSDEHGDYNFLVTPDIYVICTMKDGYMPSTEIQLSIDDENTEINFILNETQSEIEPETGPDEVNDILVENTVQKAIMDGNVGAKISLMQLIDNSNPKTEIHFYTNPNPYSIKVGTTSESIVSFTVSSTDNTTSTFFIVDIGKDVWNGTDNVTVSIDGMELSRLPVNALSGSQNEYSDGYIVLHSKSGLKICTLVTDFQEHQIAIHSIAPTLLETTINLTVVALYASLIAVFAILIAIPIVRSWRKIE